MNRRTSILTGLAALGVGGWYFGSNSNPQGLPNSTLIGAANAQTTGTEADIDTSTIPDMIAGNPEATVEVIEYASYTCPHCANFHAEGYKMLKADFIDTGKIRFVYREVYFDRFGLWASLVARCGGPEKFFGITDLIYAGQSEWSRAGDPAAIVEELRKIGRLAGMDSETLEACLQDGDKARTLVAWFKENAEEHGIDSTPSFVINGTKYSNMPYDEMKAIIEGELDA